MDSKYYELIQRLFNEQSDFHTMFGTSIAPAKIKALSGDYVILNTKHGEQNIDVHCHYSQVDVISRV